MATKEERAKEKRSQAEMRSKGTTGEHIVTEDDYSLDLKLALNWYSAHKDNKIKKKWCLDYLTKHKRSEVNQLKALPDWRFMQLGSMCRISMIDGFISVAHRDWMEITFKKYASLGKDEIKRLASIETNKPEKNPLKKVDPKYYEYCVYLDDEIDIFVNTGKNDAFNIKSFIATNNISPRDASQIANEYSRLQYEVEEALTGDDPDLVDGYSYFTKTELKNYLKFINNIINELAQQKANRKPRAVKEKPASVLVKWLEYTKEFPELKLTSIDVKKLINSKEVWLYNTVTRRLSRYIAADKSGMTVKGKSLKNFNIEKSSGKMIRKPEKFFDTLVMAKAAMEKSYNDIKAVEGSVSGRVNSNELILEVF